MEDRIQQSKLINKAIIIVSILLVFALLIYVGKDVMVLYTHPVYKYSIKYPSSWKRLDNYAEGTVGFVSPKESSLDAFLENVSVIVQNQGENVLSLGKYTETAIFQIKVTFKEGIEVLESESGGTYLSGKPAYKFVYIVQGDPGLKIMHVWTVDGAIGYQLTYTASVPRFDEYKDIFDKMVDSFRLP